MLVETARPAQGVAEAGVLLSVRDLSVSLAGRGGVLRIVRDVSFDIREGEIVGLVGESGCGKSMTALTMMGLHARPPGAQVNGSILFEGGDLLQLRRERLRRHAGRRISMIFQEPMSALDPVFTIGEQISEVVQTHERTGWRAALATYYAVPVFAFYPLLIIVFGLGDMPEIFIGFMLAVVAVIVSVLSGLDRVPRALLKTARVSQLGEWETAWRITLPFIGPHILTGARLALAYALIGVIGAEFIMSSSGMGYEISYAYNNFDNATMYPLILLIVAASVTINSVLGRWEAVLMRRRGLA